jgi:hypothetical protein
VAEAVEGFLASMKPWIQTPSTAKRKKGKRKEGQDEMICEDFSALIVYSSQPWDVKFSFCLQFQT